MGQFSVGISCPLLLLHFGWYPTTIVPQRPLTVWCYLGGISYNLANSFVDALFSHAALWGCSLDRLPSLVGFSWSQVLAQWLFLRFMVYFFPFALHVPSYTIHKPRAHVPFLWWQALGAVFGTSHWDVAVDYVWTGFLIFDWWVGTRVGLHTLEALRSLPSKLLQSN